MRPLTNIFKVHSGACFVFQELKDARKVCFIGSVDGFLTHTPVLAQQAREKLQVFVSIVPQKYFVERIAGDLAEVSVLVTPGKSPATYSPTPDQVRKLAQAHVYFRIGVSFENGFMHKIASIAPDTRVVDTRKGILLREMEDHIHEQDLHGAHSHDPDGKAEHDLHGRGDGHADMGRAGIPTSG